MEERSSYGYQIGGINKLLCRVLQKEIRLSLLLQELGFSDDEINIIRTEYLDSLLVLIVDTLKEYIYAREDAERYWLILNRRFGLIGGKGETFQEIGVELGISRERVRQLEKKAIRKLALPSRKKLLKEKISYQVSVWLRGISHYSIVTPEPFNVNGSVEQKNDKKVPDYVMEKRKKFPRAYEPWSVEEEKFLQAEFLKNKNTKQLSGLFQRSEGAIKSRLRKLNLIDMVYEMF